MEEAKPDEPNESTQRATVRCEDFASREAAQEYLDTRATEADSEIIDPDDNGRACDEGAYIFAGSSDQGPARTTSSPSPTSASASSSGLSMSEEAAAQAEMNCRVLAYAQEEGMSQQEAGDFSERLADRIVDKFEDDPSLTASPAGNQVLDDMGVPRYPQCEGGTEE